MQVTLLLGWFTPLYVTYVIELNAKRCFSVRATGAQCPGLLRRMLKDAHVYVLAYANLAMLLVNAVALAVKRGYL